MKPLCHFCAAKPVKADLRYYCSLRCAASDAINDMNYRSVEWCDRCEAWSGDCSHRHESNLTDEGRDKGREVGNAKQAQAAIDENLDLVVALYRLRSGGMTLRDIADFFNAEGWRTRRGADWSQVQVKRLMDRTAKLDLGWVVQKWVGGWIDYSDRFATYHEARAAMTEMTDGKYQIKVYCK